MATLAERRVQRARHISADRWFYSGMAALLAAVMFAGFAPSYYLHGDAPLDVGTYLDRPLQPIRGLFLLHGAAFSAWFALQLAQSLLIAGKKLAWHKWLGQFALVLAPLMVLLGVLVALYSVRHGFHGTTRPGVQSASTPLLYVTWFSGFVVAGLTLRKKPEAHKRLMLLASLAVIGPAVGRIEALPYPAWLPDWWDWSILFALPLVVWDLARLKRLHPATLIGVPLLVAMFPFMLWVRTMPWWMHMVGALAS
jgi:hypothetical protein